VTLDGWEQVVRYAGFVVFAIALAHSAIVAVIAVGRPVGRSSGLATRSKALVVYGLGSLPWFLLFALLWRPLPVDPGDGLRAALLAVGAGLGIAGAWFYQWGRHELGAMYNVSSSLGSQLFEDHRLVTSGPYALCRHPMYLGLALAAIGGLAVYRTWSFVFALVALVLAGMKAVAEERLLAEEFGDEWARFAATVPRWFPRLGGAGPAKPKEESHVHTGSEQA
jgi:protein-S-isoprenylcysteine O-methyltransferase Ste14